MKAINRAVIISLLVLGVISSIGCSAPLSTREKGGLMGAGLGIGSGAIIGSVAGNAVLGVALGGPLGLIGGALIGHQLMGHEQKAARNSNGR